MGASMRDQLRPLLANRTPDVNSCLRKIPYKTEGAAEEARHMLLSMYSEYGRLKAGGLHSYLCFNCHQWHLANRPAA